MQDNMMQTFFHPAKLRVLTELMRMETGTAKQLLERCPEIPQATLYRYLKRMVQDEIIEVVEERPVRGVTEKVYAVCTDMGKTGNKLREEGGEQAYMNLLSSFLMTLMQQFQSYVARPDSDILGSYASFTVASIYATDEELIDFMGKFGELLAPLTSNEPSEGRKYRSLATIVTPPQDLQRHIK